MLYKIFIIVFSKLFGNSPVIALNCYNNLIQIKYNIEGIALETIYNGLLKLRKCYSGKYAVRALIVHPGMLQVIIGDPEEVAKIGEGTGDIVIPVC